jgi:hypothetical protein
MRNDIMHARVAKDGRYKLLAFTPMEISGAYSAALEVYSTMVREVERRLDSR